MTEEREVSRGTCKKCGKRCHYVVVSYSRGLWVHDDTGDYHSTTPVWHDANTHIMRDNDPKVIAWNKAAR